tara:strand:- start:901 stop:1092 length:192 start_codon:yes stop_codon:yes gene_type:complete
MRKDIPLKDSFKYPDMVSIRVTSEMKKKIYLLKEMGVDVGKLLRGTLNDAIEDAFKVLDSKVS